MKKIKLAKSNLAVAYFGSSDFSANFLEKLITDQSINRLVTVDFIITQPDRPVGRDQILTPTPVRQIAEKYKIINKVSFPPPIGVEGRLRRESKLNIPFKKCYYSLDPLLRGDDKKISLNLEFSAFKNIDLALVYAYGELIPKELLNLPKYGFWNIHPSLLPKYRGTSPIAAPLINGDKITGVTIIKMDEEIDHGPIIAQESLTIETNDKRPDLEKKLTNLAYEMFKKLLKSEDTFFETIARGPLGGVAVEKNGIKLLQQNHKSATYTKKLSKHDGFIEISELKNQLSKNSEELFNLFRGLTSWPGIWTFLPNGKRLKITDIKLIRNKNICSLQIKRVQLEGKNEVDFKTFNKAYRIF